MENLEDENYALFIVEPSDWDDDDDWGYDNVRNLAIDSYRAATKEELLITLIKGLNDDTISDMNWFFLVDLKDETILEYPTCLQF